MTMMTVLQMLLFAAAAATIWLTYGRVEGLPMKRSDDARRFWIAKAGPIREELLGVQAIVVKDEEVPTGAAAECKPRNADARYSDRRYLMCAGSILTSRYILTSASCIHEATHIRHNVRAPLAAMIAPFSDTAQVIRIVEYNIHPAHQVDPREDDYALHNVAIARLACRILKPNLKEIELPVQPITEYADDESCFVAIIKKIGPTSHAMYETQAKNVADERDKRELSETADEIKETSDKVSFKTDEAGKVPDTNWNKSASRVAGISEKSNNESAENNRKLNSKIVRSIGEGRDKSGDRFSKNSLSLDKKLSVRASDGTKGCAQTGSAVMCGKIQASIVAASCDDRQPDTTWRYTDVYDNVDWINEMLGNWKHNNQTRSGMSVGGCQTCIYNFFIDYSCKDKSMCRKEGPSGSNQNHADDVKIPGIELPKCTKNHTTGEQHSNGNSNSDVRTSFFKNKSKLSLNLAYLNAVNDMYSNKRPRNDVSGDDDQNVRTGLHVADANEKREKNDTESTVARDIAGSLIPPPWFLEATSESAPKEPILMTWNSETGGSVHRKPDASDFNDYFSELDATYREPKAIGGDNAERITLNFADKSSGGKKATLEDFFGDDKYEEAGLPDEYATLYRKFLEMSRKTSKVNTGRS
ncbi:uncharacterized protein LOC103316939 isoform X2 [Nasonia vitripennis]|uniref:Peptidase S1 domain-containing protein n=1 Tax=Nasonia vitripennis TaxID=7425 RepID=A0A7M7HDC7_NASVI|nr:uncharacterized protein LOC103316939 isoform X2 [Nasonia vitripennis]